MSKRKKPVKFYYFSINGIDAEGKEVLIKFKDMFDRISKEYKSDLHRYVYEIHSDNYKLDQVNTPIFSKDDYYHIVIEKLRDSNWPSNSKLAGESKPLTLDKDSFLGEKVSILYDYENHIFMVQVNRNGISYNRLELFLSSLLKDNDLEIDVRLPIIIQKSPRKAVQKMVGYKAVDLRVNNTFSQGGKVDDLISVVKRSFSEEDTNNYNIEIKITAKKDKSTGNEYLPDSIVEDVLSYKIDGSWEKVKIRGRNEEGTIVPVDLIEDKIFSTLYFDYSEDRTLKPISVFEEMKLEYNSNGKLRSIKNLN